MVVMEEIKLISQSVKISGDRYMRKKIYTAEVGADTTNIEERKIGSELVVFCLLVFSNFSSLYLSRGNLY